jgi:NAD+ kinase
MKIAIYGNKFNKEAAPYVKELFDLLVASNVDVFLNDQLCAYSSQFFNISDALTIRKKELLLDSDTDFLISVGGDGTILDTITTVRDTKVPILGVNTGRLGFLANNTKEEVSSSVNKLIEGSFAIDSRTLLSLNSDNALFGKDNFALNEFTLHKKDSSSMVTIHVSIDGKFLNSYWADGIIIATPTGSTAYSLSCGGPLLSPGSDNFVITPIAPHNLNLRPLVVKDDVEILLTMEARDQELLTTLDSRSQTIDKETKLMLRKSDFTINLIQFEGQNFFFYNKK